MAAVTAIWSRSGLADGLLSGMATGLAPPLPVTPSEDIGLPLGELLVRLAG
jgi:hypothetical protein